MNVEKDAKNAVANEAKIDCPHDNDQENKRTTDKQEGATEQNTNYSQNLDEQHKPTTYENYEATSQNTSCTELLDEPHEPTTDEKAEAISQNTSFTQILDEPHEPTTDYKSANTSKNDYTHDIDMENQITTDIQKGATEQNTNCTQNLDAPHKPTTDENSEAVSQNTRCTHIFDEPHEQTTDEKSETTSQNTSCTHISEEPHEPTTDDKSGSYQLTAPPMTCLNTPGVRAVIALDIGTTHSRYAVLLPETPFVEEKLEYVIEDSVPTAVFFNVTLENFVACGDKAIKEHKSAVQRDERKSYLMFEKFKLELYKRMDVTAELEIKDIYGTTMYARKVYTAVINDLKQRALIHIKQKNNTIHNDEVVWVMTVPDVWEDNAKGFIRICCELSGIIKEQLIVVDESNAILAYFQNVQYFCRENMLQNVDEKNYLLIDLGGGTCDITGYHTPTDCDVGVPIIPSHKLCGVDIVCDGILDRLSSIIGENAMDCLKKEETSSYLQLKEACIQLCKTSDNTLNVPIQTFDKLCTRFRDMSFKDAVDGYGKTVSGSDSEQVDIDFNLFRKKLIVRKGLVDNALKRIIGTAISEIKHIITKQKALNIQRFFIVGGFSSLSIVQNEIQDAFKDKSVIFANDKVFSSVKGALVYGYEKTRI
ncbi:heat shock 70 kDa protein 12A-like isoform X3 [Mytilus galloprovincialis]|uniref:heat shock 70 kDa protein 12A-like isoform X3 n=1 Tax=Mytilus galloprovincialis TaxID=29158 RepID=UPI003F7B9199